VLKHVLLPTATFPSLLACRCGCMRLRLSVSISMCVSVASDCLIILLTMACISTDHPRRLRRHPISLSSVHSQWIESNWRLDCTRFRDAGTGVSACQGCSSTPLVSVNTPWTGTRRFCCRKDRFATMHSVTDRPTDRIVDSIMPIADHTACAQQYDRLTYRHVASRNFLGGNGIFGCQKTNCRGRSH